MVQTTHDGLASGESPACRISLQVNDLILDEDVFVLGKLQCCQPQLIDFPIVQREPGEVMWYHPPQTTGDSGKELS